MEKETRKEYRYEGLGVPVILEDAPMIKIRGKWTLDIDVNDLQSALFRAMSEKPVRLSGNEIRFIRHYVRMTLDQFANRFGVKHSAVIKWEKFGANSSNMNWATEKDIRLFVLVRSNATDKKFKDTYKELRNVRSSQRRLHRLNVDELASC